MAAASAWGTRPSCEKSAAGKSAEARPESECAGPIATCSTTAEVSRSPIHAAPHPETPPTCPAQRGPVGTVHQRSVTLQLRRRQQQPAAHDLQPLQQPLQPQSAGAAPQVQQLAQEQRPWAGAGGAGSQEAVHCQPHGSQACRQGDGDGLQCAGGQRLAGPGVACAWFMAGAQLCGPGGARSAAIRRSASNQAAVRAIHPPGCSSCRAQGCLRTCSRLPARRPSVWPRNRQTLRVSPVEAHEQAGATLQGK